MSKLTIEPPAPGKKNFIVKIDSTFEATPPGQNARDMMKKIGGMWFRKLNYWAIPLFSEERLRAFAATLSDEQPNVAGSFTAVIKPKRQYRKRQKEQQPIAIAEKSPSEEDHLEEPKYEEDNPIEQPVELRDEPRDEPRDEEDHFVQQPEEPKYPIEQPVELRDEPRDEEDHFVQQPEEPKYPIEQPVEPKENHDDNHDWESVDEPPPKPKQPKPKEQKRVVDPRERIKSYDRDRFIDQYVNSDASDEEIETEETYRIYEKYKNLFTFFKTFSDDVSSDEEEGCSFNAKLLRLQKKMDLL